MGQILEMSLNYVHEAAHVVYLTHVYNNTVAETFLGDELFGANRAFPIEESVDKAIKNSPEILGIIQSRSRSHRQEGSTAFKKRARR